MQDKVNQNAVELQKEISKLNNYYDDIRLYEIIDKAMFYIVSPCYELDRVQEIYYVLYQLKEILRKNEKNLS